MTTPTSWSATFQSSFSGNSLADSLIYGAQWASGSITYSFPGYDSSWSTNSYYGYGSSNSGREPWSAYFHPLFVSDQQAVRTALEAWGNVANLIFTEVSDNQLVAGDLRFAYSYASEYSSAQAWAYAPAQNPVAGDVWFNKSSTSYANTWPLGSFHFETAFHEIGHALGLKHPFVKTAENNNLLPSIWDSRSYTVMSYSAVSGDQATKFSYEPTTPMMLDILALQHLYGINSNYNAGDTIYTFSEPYSYHQTIWDAGGNDTIVSDSYLDSTIDLRSSLTGGCILGAPVYVQNSYGNNLFQTKNVWIAIGVTIENAIGGSGNDIIKGNDVKNRLEGGNGNDVMCGAGGDDTIFCGSGTDKLVFSGAKSDYKINYNFYLSIFTITDTVQSRDGTDLVSSAEFFEFSDGIVESSTFAVNNTPTGSVTISGTAMQGQTLTASNTLADLDGLGTIIYTWQAGSSVLGTGSTYIPKQDDVGKMITVKASYTDSYSSAESVSSSATAAISPIRMTTTNYIGTSTDEDVVGTDRNDTINGAGGNDKIEGGGGNDILIGGADADIMDGGSGSDIYLIAATNEYASGETISDTGTNGTDELRFTTKLASTLTLSNSISNIEQIVIGTGTAATAVTTGTTAINVNAAALAFGMVMLGNNGANILTSGAGNDTLRGNGGIDTFNVTAGTDFVVDLGNGGADELNVAAGATVNATVTAAWTASATSINRGTVNLSTNGLAVNLSRVTTTGTNGFNLTNTSTKGATLTGSGMDDQLVGNKSNDTLLGNAGNDTINGGKGADKLTGGAGSDTFVFTAGDSGQASYFETINDYAKGAVGTGDLIDFSVALNIGGSTAAANSRQASISSETGIAIFATGSGMTLQDAMADVVTSFTAAGDAAGQFTFFKIKNTGIYYLLISDGMAGVTSNDVLMQLVGVSTINEVDLTAGNLTILV